MVATTLLLCFFYVLGYYVLRDVHLSHLNKRLLTYLNKAHSVTLPTTTLISSITK